MTPSPVIAAPLQGPYKKPWDKALSYGLCLGPECSGISVQEQVAASVLTPHSRAG